MRPTDLARDDTPTVPVLQDVVRRLEAENDCYEAIFTLQPTNPLLFGSVAFATGCVALLASAAPAWRATRVDPVAVLSDS